MNLHKTKVLSQLDTSAFTTLSTAQHVDPSRGLLVLGIPVGSRELVEDEVAVVVARAAKFCHALTLVAADVSHLAFVA